MTSADALGKTNVADTETPTAATGIGERYAQLLSPSTIFVCLATMHKGITSVLVIGDSL